MTVTQRDPRHYTTLGKVLRLDLRVHGPLAAFCLVGVLVATVIAAVFRLEILFVAAFGLTSLLSVARQIMDASGAAPFTRLVVALPVSRRMVVTSHYAFMGIVALLVLALSSAAAWVVRPGGWFAAGTVLWFWAVTLAVVSIVSPFWLAGHSLRAWAGLVVFTALMLTGAIGLGSLGEGEIPGSVGRIGAVVCAPVALVCFVVSWLVVWLRAKQEDSRLQSQ